MVFSETDKKKIVRLLSSGHKLEAVRAIQQEFGYDLESAFVLAEQWNEHINTDHTVHDLNQQLLQQNQELARKEKELKKTNKQLRASQREIKETQELLTSINTNLSEGIYRSHATGGLVYVNQAFVKLFGYDSEADMLNTPSKELYANPNSRQGLTETIIKDKSRSNVEVLYKRKDGSTFWGRNSYFLTFDSDGHAIFDGAIMDITEEKEAQKKILESQRLLESINTNLSEGIYRSKKKGGLVYANKAFAKMFGYTSVDEILSVKSINLYADPKTREEPINPHKDDKDRSNEETLFKRKDGSTFWGLNTYLVTVDEDGNEVYDGAVRDITEEKIYQQKLNRLNEELLKRNSELARQERQLEESNEALRAQSDNLVETLEELSDRNFELDQLVYRTSHDLRSPLRSILGLVNLYKLENSEESEHVSKIEDRIVKMDDFIKSMLDYSRASRMGVKNTLVDVEQLINESIEDLEFLDGFRNMDISVATTGDTEKLYVDKLRLKIVLGNILSNAIKYRNPDLDVNKLDIHITIEEDMVRMEFSDNGIGISKEYLAKVFDMFYRATEQSDGSGLGMYIVKQSVERLNGEIMIDSELGVGTKITINLPLGKNHNDDSADS